MHLSGHVSTLVPSSVCPHHKDQRHSEGPQKRNGPLAFCRSQFKRTLTPEETRTDQKQNPGDLSEDEEILGQLSIPESKDVQGGEEQNDTHGDRPDAPGLQRQEIGRVACEDIRDACDRSGPDHKQLGPPEQETDAGTVGLPQIDVISAGFRERRGQLRVAEAAAQGQQSADDPGGEDRRGGV